MFKMKVTKVIAKFVEVLLPKFSGTNTGLVICLEVKVAESYCKSGDRYVHLLFHRPGNYTKVLWHVSNELKPHVEIKTWKLEADHDSGWVTDGLESPMNKLAEKIASEHKLRLFPLNKFSEATADFSLFFGTPQIVHLKSYVYDQEKRTFTVEYA